MTRSVKFHSVYEIPYFRKSHNTFHFGGLFALKQWISSLLKDDTVARVNNKHLMTDPDQLILFPENLNVFPRRRRGKH